MADQQTLKNYKEFLQDETDSAALYRAISEVEKQPPLAEVYRKMAESEEAHTRFWAEKLNAEGHPTKTRPGWRTRALIALARRFGPGLVLPTMIGLERDGSSGYAGRPELKDGKMAVEERSHERLLSTIVRKTPGGMTGGFLAILEGRHRAGGNALRAAVLGANDGLVSNLSLVMGVAGAALSARSIIITGLAGLLAGAGSMALGEWLSVQSSRELYEHQISIEAREIKDAPEEELEELALIYQSKGLTADKAHELAAQIMSDEAITIDTLAREELGVNPDELGGSAWEAAITSFILFALGAIIPLAPYFFLTGMTAVFTSLGVSALGLFFIGAMITILTGKNAVKAGLRQVSIGLLAAGIIYGIGHLVGGTIRG